MYDDVLKEFKGDSTKADNLRDLRRKQPRGTSECRNTGEETFLFFNNEERSWVTKSIAACL